MYLHICKNTIIKTENIIGIFNIDSIKDTKEYLELTENNEVEDVSEGLNKTIIFVKENNKNKLYISNISVATLIKRAKINID